MGVVSPPGFTVGQQSSYHGMAPGTQLLDLLTCGFLTFGGQVCKRPRSYQKGACQGKTEGKV